MSNKKMKRTDGVIPSSSMKMPASIGSFNTPTSDYSYTKGEHVKRTKTQGPMF